MNLVTTTNLSAAHAEMVAIMISQQVVGYFDLGGKGLPQYELAPARSRARCASARSCGPASGEGPKVPDWVASLEQRGISVAQDVCRDEAAAVLRYYVESGGMIYNARQGA